MFVDLTSPFYLLP